MALTLRSSCWTLRVLYGPLKRVVGDLLPAVLPDRVVRASRELLVVCDRPGVAVVLGVRLVDREPPRRVTAGNHTPSEKVPPIASSAQRDPAIQVEKANLHTQAHDGVFDDVAAVTPG